MKTKLAKNRRIRIAVLELLRSVYPGALDMRGLMFALDNLGYPMPEADLAAHVSYMEEKGYLSFKSREGEGYSISYVSLTAEGWDLIDGIKIDMGVDKRL